MLKNRQILVSAIGIVLGVVASEAVSTGCGSSLTPEEACTDCMQIDLEPWNCYDEIGENVTYRGTMCVEPGLDASQVVFECAGEFPIVGTGKAKPTPCDGMGESGADDGVDGGSADGSGSCSSYDPSANVTFALGPLRRVVNGLFVDALIADPLPLLECDGARLEPLSSGYYEVTGATSGTFLYELGLRNGDIPLELNGRSLETFEDGAEVLGELYLEGELDYSLLLERNGNPLTLPYELYYDPISP
jgi:hypothetical protein